MANSNGRHLSQRGTKLNHTAVLSPSSEQSNAQEITMEDINLHLEDEDEFEDIAAGEIMEGEDSDGFELIHSEAQSLSGNRTKLPTETFRGTWEGAYHETARAADDVKKASKNYASSIANSNITRAGLAISGAIASSANQSALLVANKALEASGRDESKLPKKIKEWLKTKQRRDEAKRKAAAAKREREERKALAVLIAEGKVAEVPPCRPESQANSQTADDGSEYSTDSMDDEEIRNMRAINARPPPPGPQDPLESLWSKPSSYSLEERQDRNKVLTKVASTPGNPWGDNSPDTPSLENPTLQDGSKNGDSTIHLLKTPASTTRVFHDHQTQDTIHHRLVKPLQANPPFSPLFEANAEQSPYLPRDQYDNIILEVENPSAGSDDHIAYSTPY